VKLCQDQGMLRQSGGGPPARGRLPTFLDDSQGEGDAARHVVQVKGFCRRCWPPSGWLVFKVARAVHLLAFPPSASARFATIKRRIRGEKETPDIPIWCVDSAHCVKMKMEYPKRRQTRV
jgi:hypothetical protein